MKRLALLTILLLGGLSAVQVSTAAAVPNLSATVNRLAAQAGIPGHPVCVSAPRMNALSGGPSSDGYDVVGLTDMHSRQVWLLNRVCNSLRGWDLSHESTLTGPELLAVSTLYHEAAHARGIGSEHAAECAGAQGVLGLVASRYPGSYEQVHRWLTVSVHRAPGYKLLPSCPVLWGE